MALLASSSTSYVLPYVLPNAQPSLLTEQNRRELAELGYTVVTNVLTNEEVQAALTGIWTGLATLCGTTLSDINNWPDWRWPHSLSIKGLIQHYGSLSHCQAVWDVRQNPKVAGVFADIWQVNSSELLTSFDGLGVQKPPEYTKKYSDPLGTPWHHIDQGAGKQGLQCVQGFVNLIEGTSEDGCLIVRPRSHLYHQAFHETFPGHQADWVLLTDQEKAWYDAIAAQSPNSMFDFHGCAPIRVAAPAGSLVLWDSRTVHANATALAQRSIPKFRVVIYVCMTPRSWATEKNLEKKRKYLLEGRVTTHWPHQVKVFGKVPRLYGDTSFDDSFAIDKAVKKVPQLTALGQRLAGFNGDNTV